MLHYVQTKQMGVLDIPAHGGARRLYKSRYCYANTTDSAVLANCAQYRIATHDLLTSIQGDEQ